MIGLKKFSANLLLVTTLVASCTGNAAPPSSPAGGNAFTNALIPLDSAPAGLTEIAVLHPTWQSGSVWGVQYIMENNHVFSVYAEGGRLVEWSVDTGGIVATHELGIADSRAVQFSSDGKVLIGPTRLVSTVNENTHLPDDYLAGISAWETASGELIECFSLPCPGREEEPLSAESGAILDPLGNQVITYNEYSIRIIDFSAAQTKIDFVNSEDSDYSWSIGRVAINPVDQRMAVIYQEGLVETRGSLIITIADGEENDLEDVPAAVFDPSGDLLAFIRGNRLVILKVGRYSGEQVFDQEMDTAFSLKFDQTGKLLFVASKDKTTVFDVAEKQVVVEYVTPKITTFEISQNNRLLIWGDNLGTIHIWGIEAQ